MDKIQIAIVDNYLMPMAEKKYKDDVKEWEDKIKQESNRNAEKLQDSQFAASLGLPPNLPKRTINILKRTMAVDSLGPQKPKIDKIYQKYGF